MSKNHDKISKLIQDNLPPIFRGLRIIDTDKKVVYCKRCVISNQRPRLMFNEEGICAACLFAEYKHNTINWDEREKKLEELCDKFRSKDEGWDIIVPVSGCIPYFFFKVYATSPLSLIPLSGKIISQPSSLLLNLSHNSSNFFSLSSQFIVLCLYSANKQAAQIPSSLNINRGL